MNTSLKYNFNDDTFYNYKVRSININNVQMYIANDLINQYNIKNKTNKLFKDWFRSKDTQELLNVIRNEKNIPNEPLNNFVEDFNNYGDIQGVIQKIDLYTSKETYRKEYIVCEELMHDILRFLDPLYTIKIVKFLKNIQSKNYNYSIL